MSLCDQCFAPGTCCKNFALGVGNGKSAEEAKAILERIKENGAPDGAPALPFEPVELVKTQDVPEGFWRWSCSKLAPDGRCSIYETRPQLCRNYEPASDPICVHFMGAESDERSILP